LETYPKALLHGITSLQQYEEYSVISLGVLITVLGKTVSPFPW